MANYYTKAEITEKANGTFTAIASSNKVDRHGEIVSVEGWDLKNYKKNPVLLWAHDHTIPAIGKATKIWVEGTGKNAKLMFSGVWQEATELGKAVKSLVEDGIINSFSVGFMPIDMDGNTYTKQELLEISLVNVPANPEAMMRAYKSLNKSGFDNDTMQQLGIPVAVIDKLDELSNDVKELKEQMTQVKTLQTVAPAQIVKTRLSMLKVIARATDKLNEGENKNLPKADKKELTKVIKLATEKLIVAEKGRL